MVYTVTSSSSRSTSWYRDWSLPRVSTATMPLTLSWYTPGMTPMTVSGWVVVACGATPARTRWNSPLTNKPGWCCCCWAGPWPPAAWWKALVGVTVEPPLPMLPSPPRTAKDMPPSQDSLPASTPSSAAAAAAAEEVLLLLPPPDTSHSSCHVILNCTCSGLLLRLVSCSCSCSGCPT